MEVHTLQSVELLMCALLMELQTFLAHTAMNMLMLLYDMW